MLGALFKMDTFNVVSQFQVQVGTSPAISDNFEKKIEEYNEDHTQSDSHPEVSSLVNHSPHTFNIDPDQLHHMVTRAQEEVIYSSPGLHQRSKVKCVLQASHNFAVKTPLQQKKQAIFYWPFNN